MSKKSEFIQQVLPHALEVQEKYGIPASLVMAQAALETGWGEHVKGNNYFGIKAGKSWKGDTAHIGTHEVIDGKRIAMKDSFRAYSGLADSVANYGKFLAENVRYKAVQLADNAYEAAEAVHRAGYATDPKYAEQLKDIIRSNNLTQYDDGKYQGYTENKDQFAQLLKGLFDILKTLVVSLIPGMGNGTEADHNTIETPKVTGSKVAAVATPARA